MRGMLFAVLVVLAVSGAQCPFATRQVSSSPGIGQGFSKQKVLDLLGEPEKREVLTRGSHDFDSNALRAELFSEFPPGMQVEVWYYDDSEVREGLVRHVYFAKGADTVLASGSWFGNELDAAKSHKR